MLSKSLVSKYVCLSFAIAGLVALLATPAFAQGQQPPPNPDASFLNFFRKTELSGFADLYYTYNLNKPAKPCTTLAGVAVFNCLSNFNFAHNSFSLNLAELALEKKPASDSRGGFRVDLDYGPTTTWVHGLEPGGTTTYQNIQQAYVSYLAPAGKGLQLDFGKFVTWNGQEVIETKDNWNYSRGLLFAWAIPYYHTGVRAAYAVNDKVSVTGFLVNGWNNVSDNNTGKTVAVSGTLKLASSLSASETYIVGPEQTNNNRRLRQMSHTEATYTPRKHVTVVGTYDWDYDREPRSGYWGEGVSTYARYQPNGWFALTPRAEHYFDKGGFVTGIRQRVKEVTLTAELKHRDGVIVMLECRRDFSNMSYFTEHDRPGAKKHQDTITLGMTYAFSTKIAGRAENLAR